MVMSMWPYLASRSKNKQESKRKKPMSSEHTKAFRVQRAARELLIAEADQMGVELPGELNAIAGDLMDFAHSLIHLLNDTLRGHITEESKHIVIPIIRSTYIVMKDSKALRSVRALDANEAYIMLKPKAGEEVFIRVESR